MDLKGYKQEDLVKIIQASVLGNIEAVRYLVERGADIHIQDEFPLICASLYGNTDIVKYLVEAGADVHVRDDLPLQLAASSGHYGVVKYLVEVGADVRRVNFGELVLKDRGMVHLLLDGMGEEDLLLFLVSESKEIREAAREHLEGRQSCMR